MIIFAFNISEKNVWTILKQKKKQGRLKLLVIPYVQDTIASAFTRSFSLHKHSGSYQLPCYIGRIQGSESWSNLPEVAQQ